MVLSTLSVNRRDGEECRVARIRLTDAPVCRKQPVIVAQDGLFQPRHFRVAVSRRWAWSRVRKSLHGADGVRLLDLLIESVVIEVVAVDFAQAKIGAVSPVVRPAECR